MQKIFINGLNAKAGGGKSIFNNYLSILKESKLNHTYIVLAPNNEEYKKYSGKNINILTLPYYYNKLFLYPFLYNYYLNKLLKKQKIDVVFNLADIPIKTQIKQIFLFDWSYAVYPNSKIWKMMDYKSRLIRLAKLYFFKSNLKYIDLLLAQTETMKNRLWNIYKLDNVEVIPNAVSIGNLKTKSKINFNLPSGIKLLYLTHYYPHKNLEIFISLGKKIKELGLQYRLITTIESNQHKKAKIFLKELKKFKLEDVIINVGAVKMEDVPALYSQCDGLLMPTLLESFSGTYIEAMFHKMPIFTSNLDFASGVCKDAATYFDPFNENDILIKIETVYKNELIKKEKINNGLKVLESLPDWNQTFLLYNKYINIELNR